MLYTKTQYYYFEFIYLFECLRLGLHSLAVISTPGKTADTVAPATKAAPFLESDTALLSRHWPLVSGH